MINYTFASRMKNVNFSPSQKIISKVRELKKQGIKVVNFGTKEDTPKCAKEAAIKMIETEEASYYTDPKGLPELREAVAEKLLRFNKIEADPEKNIVITIGGKQALFVTLLALVDRNDEILIEDPGWMSFEPAVYMSGGTPVRVPLKEENEYKISVKDIEQKITNRTKMIILCNPHNPTGAVLDQADLAAIAEIAKRHDLLIVMDEAYEDFTYDGANHISMAALDDMKERTITLQTTSKIYNMFGWRVGWVVAEDEIIKQILSIHSHSVTCATSFAQAGAVPAIKEALGQGDLPISEVVNKYEKSRNAMVEGLRKIDGVSCVNPKGAYFAFPNFGFLKMNSNELCNYLLDKARVAATPGSAFGPQGEKHLRLVFNSPQKEINEGLEKISSALSNLR